MLSPRHAHGFASNTDMINYDRSTNPMNQTQKMIGAKPNTAMANGTRPKLHQDLSKITHPDQIA